MKKRLIIFGVIFWLLHSLNSSAFAASYLYVAEFTGEKISRVDNIGTVTTYATLPVGARAWDLAVGFNSNLYVTDYANNRIMQIDKLGVVTNANFATGITNPKGMTYYNNNLYVISDDNTIKKVDSTGVVSTFWAGTGATLFGITTGEVGGYTDPFYNTLGTVTRYVYSVDAGGAGAQFSNLGVNPGAFATDLTFGPGGFLYVVDGAGNVLKIDALGNASTLYASALAPADRGIASDGTYLYITIGGTLARIHQDGSIDLNWAIGLNTPLGIFFGEIPEPASILSLSMLMLGWGVCFFRKKV